MFRMQGMTKDQLAKKYLIQNHLFRGVGVALALMGLIVFVTFYQKFIDGDVMNFIRRPYLVAVMIIPFLPALVLLLMSKRARRNAANVLAKNPAETGDKAKKQT